MKESKSNHHYEDPIIPDELEYQDAYWLDALSKIEAYERKADGRKKLGWLCLAVVIIGICWTGAYFINEETSPNNLQAFAQEEIVNIGAEKNDTVVAKDSITKLINTVKSLHTDELVIENRQAKNESDFTESNSRHVVSNSNSDFGNIREHSEWRMNKDDLASHRKKRAEETFVKQVEVSSADGANREFNKLINDFDGGTQTDNDNKLTAHNEGLISNSVADHMAANYIQSRFGCFEIPNAHLAPHVYLPYSRPWIEPKWRFGAYVGMSFVTHYASPLRDVNTDPIGGLRIERNVKNKWAFRSGLEYYAIGNVRKPYSVTSIAYDVNYIKTITTVETHRLFYLSVPLSVGYRFNNRHQIFWGGGVSYMLTGENEISLHRVTPSSSELLNTREDKGFVQGFVDVPLFAHFGYEWRMSNHLYCNLGFQYGLTDITKNDYFNNPGVDRNTRLTVVLGYDFYKK